MPKGVIMPKGRTEVVYIFLGQRNMQYDPFEICELREWIDAKVSLCPHKNVSYGISDAYRIEREPVMLRPDGYTVDLYSETRRVVCPNCGKRKTVVFQAYDTSSAWYQETRFDYGKE